MAPAPPLVRAPQGTPAHKTYHAGERHVQQLAGVLNKAEAVGTAPQLSPDVLSHSFPTVLSVNIS